MRSIQTAVVSTLHGLTVFTKSMPTPITVMMLAVIDKGSIVLAWDSKIAEKYRKRKDTVRILKAGSLLAVT